VNELTHDGRLIKRSGDCVETFSPLALRYRPARPVKTDKPLHGNDKRAHANRKRVHAIMRQMTGRAV